MPARSRPLLSVRLIGSADVVNAEKERLVARFGHALREPTTCRTSTHPASHAGEIRVYITVTRREPI